MIIRLLGYVKVTNFIHLLLPHFCFTGVNFRGDFQYVRQVDFQRVEFEPSELENPRSQSRALTIYLLNLSFHTCKSK